MAKKLVTLCIVVIIFCGGCVASKTTTVSTDTSSQELLRVGITTNAPPMAYRENGSVTGLEAEFARGLAAKNQQTIHFVELNWDEQIPALLSGEIDIIMSAMTITDSRRYRIAFADPYMVTGQVSLVRLSEYNRFSDGFSSLLNPMVRVGTVKATTGEYLVVQNKAKGDILKFTSAEDGVQALLKNKIDVFVYDLPMNFYLGAKYANLGLTPVTVPISREYIAWGIRKEDTKLLNQANSYLKDLQNTGKLKQMITHWIPFYEKLYNK